MIETIYLPKYLRIHYNDDASAEILKRRKYRTLMCCYIFEPVGIMGSECVYSI